MGGAFYSFDLPCPTQEWMTNLFYIMDRPSSTLDEPSQTLNEQFHTKGLPSHTIGWIISNQSWTILYCCWTISFDQFDAASSTTAGQSHALDGHLPPWMNCFKSVMDNVPSWSRNLRNGVAHIGP